MMVEPAGAHGDGAAVPEAVPRAPESTGTAPKGSSSNAGIYAAGTYWDNRYAEKQQNFDWFFSYPALKEAMRALPKDTPCLHVGCGNSIIQEGMADDGFKSIVNIDISSIVIQQMQQQHQANAALIYKVADCRDLSQFPDASFGSCLDKGTLDAVLCGSGGMADAQRYLTEVDRVLAPGGVFLLITLGPPSGRVGLLRGQGHASWEVTVLLLPKPTLYLASEASITGRSAVSTAHSMDSKDDPVDLDGPYGLDEAVALLATSPGGGCGAREPKDHFFAYVCRKPAVPAAPLDKSAQAAAKMLADLTCDSPLGSPARPYVVGCASPASDAGDVQVHDQEPTSKSSVLSTSGVAEGSSEPLQKLLEGALNSAMDPTHLGAPGTVTAPAIPDAVLTPNGDV